MSSGGSLQVGVSLLGGRPARRYALAALDRQYQSMAAQGTTESTSIRRSMRQAAAADPSQACLDQVTALRNEVAALLQRRQSPEDEAVDDFFGEVDG